MLAVVSAAFWGSSDTALCLPSAGNETKPGLFKRWLEGSETEKEREFDNCTIYGVAFLAVQVVARAH